MSDNLPDEIFDIPGPDGVPTGRLNARMARSRGLSEEDVAALVLSHQIRHMLFEAAKAVEKTPENMRLLAGVFDALEGEQQELWGFDRNPAFRRWFDLPGCSCPKVDNADMLGTGMRVISAECPAHGGNPAFEAKRESKELGGSLPESPEVVVPTGI